VNEVIEWYTKEWLSITHTPTTRAWVEAIDNMKESAIQKFGTEPANTSWNEFEEQRGWKTT
jgi:hypothetical protein